MSFPAGEKITLLRRVKDPDPDVDGNDTYHDVPSTVVGAFDPAIGFERTSGMDQVQTQPQVLLPAGTDVSSVDAVIVRGDEYEVDGVSNVWKSPYTGWQAGVVVPLKRVTG